MRHGTTPQVEASGGDVRRVPPVRGEVAVRRLRRGLLRWVLRLRAPSRHKGLYLNVLVGREDAESVLLFFLSWALRFWKSERLIKPTAGSRGVEKRRVVPIGVGHRK